METTRDASWDLAPLRDHPGSREAAHACFDPAGGCDFWRRWANCDWRGDNSVRRSISKPICENLRIANQERNMDVEKRSYRWTVIMRNAENKIQKSPTESYISSQCELVKTQMTTFWSTLLPKFFKFKYVIDEACFKIFLCVGWRVCLDLCGFSLACWT